MNQFIKKSLIFLFLIILTTFLLNKFQSIYNNEQIHFRYKYQEIFNNKVNSKYLFLGSSQVVHSINPQIINLDNQRNSYNFAFNGANPKYFDDFYNIFIKQFYKEPDVIILGVESFLFDTTILQNKIEFDSEYFDKNLMYEFVTSNKYEEYNLYTTDLIINYFPILKYRKDFKYSLRLNRGNPDYKKEKYQLGFMPYNRILNEYSKKRFFSNVNINKEQVKYFKRFLNQLKQENKKVVILYCPELNPDENHFRNEKTVKIINDLANNYNFPVLNYNLEFISEINSDETLFSDWGHMNEKGSQIFSKKLSSDLKKLGL